MNARFMTDGESRLRRSPEFQKRLRELHASVCARYATELAEAGFFRRINLRWRIASEFRRERHRLEPSSQALYCSRAKDIRSVAKSP